MSNLEEVAGQLSEAANTRAAQTLTEALGSLELASVTFANASEGSRDATSAEVQLALAIAVTCTQEAMGYVFDGTTAIREYAHRIGVDLTPPVFEPPQESGADAKYILPEETVLARLTTSSKPEGAPDPHIPKAVAEQAKTIITSILNGVNYEDIAGYITQGSERIIFRLPDGNILKLPYLGGNSGAAPSKEAALEMNQKYVAAMTRVEGKDGFEQFVGWFDEATGATICKEVEGQTLDNMSEAEQAVIPQAPFDKLMLTLQTACDLRISMDYHPSNIMYDPQTGFTLIDFGDWQHEPNEQAEKIAKDFATRSILFHEDVISDIGNFAPLPPAGKPFYYAYKNAFGQEAASRLLQMWQDVEHFSLPADLY